MNPVVVALLKWPRFRIRARQLVPTFGEPSFSAVKHVSELVNYPRDQVVVRKVSENWLHTAIRLVTEYKGLAGEIRICGIDTENNHHCVDRLLQVSGLGAGVPSYYISSRLIPYFSISPPKCTA